MAHPKRRTSKQRRNKRRTHYVAEIPTMATCSNCSSTVLYHHVCPTCGFYRGKLVINMEKTE